MAAYERFSSVDDFARKASRVLPKPLFDYVDAGAVDELSSGRNIASLDGYALRPRVLGGAASVNLATSILSKPHALPLMLGPTGLAGCLWPDGEICAAKAAHAAGISYCLSTVSVCSIEAVRAATPGDLAFQLYVTRDRRTTEDLVDRASTAGYSTLFVTVDAPVLGKRERMERGGLEPSIRQSLRTLGSLAARPGWLSRMVGNGALRLGNFPGQPGSIFQQAHRFTTQLDPTLGWQDINWLRKRWGGRLVLKGIVHPDDARRACDAGADAVVVSNHGGRQLDGAEATVDALGGIADAVGKRAEVYFDGGIRRGRHIAVALALGARACLIGRAQLYGLAVAGEAGVARIIELLAEELRISATLMGKSSVSEFSAGDVARLPEVQPGGAAPVSHSLLLVPRGERRHGGTAQHK